MAARGAFVVACALAGAAGAAPRISVHPAFAPIRSRDDACLVVTVENDADARQVTLRAQRDHADSAATATTDLRLDLAPFARKHAWMRMLPGYEQRARIDVIDRAEVIATDAADFGQGSEMRALIAVIGAAPPALLSHARRTIEAVVSEAVPEDLPGDVDAWPRAQAIAWPRPRPGLTQAQAAALDRMVRGGARLVVGVEPEAPDALASMGLGALLPAQPSRRAGLSIALEHADPAATPLGDRGALLVQRGFGEVVLVPGPLDDDALDWSALLGIPVPTPETEQALRRMWWSTEASLGWRTLMYDAAPHPPLRGAIAVLLAFFTAAVVVDGWLARRAVKKGRRRRFAWLAFPLMVLVATACGFTIADRASGGDMRVLRVDVVDVARDGSASGHTSLIVVRGGSGDMSVETEGASLRSATLGNWGGDRATPLSLHAGADPAQPVERALLRARTWDTLHVATRWDAPPMPALDPSGGALPPCAGARFWSHCATGACPPEDIQPPEPRIANLMSEAGDSTRRTGPVMLLALTRAVGPPIRIDGSALATENDVTIVRYALDPSAENVKAWGSRK